MELKTYSQLLLLLKRKERTLLRTGSHTIAGVFGMMKASAIDGRARNCAVLGRALATPILVTGI